jgi:phosphoenolpyruvate carboxylase
VEWAGILDGFSRDSLERYRHLVSDEGSFLEYFHRASPIDELGDLNIGSRPARRQAGRSLAGLRAIPWVFAWMQNRHLLPSWYAAGSTLQAFIQQAPHNQALLREMYQVWPFFKSLIDNLQMTLAKADMRVAQAYSRLVPDATVSRAVYGETFAEFERTKQAVLAVTGTSDLLDDNPVLKRSIRLRNPYVDPLSYMQVQLLKESRSGALSEEARRQATEAILVTINGIAAGLRNTG